LNKYLQQSSAVLWALIVIVIIVASSCKKDDVFAGDMPNFTPSVDTLTFDTVFTTVGSATRFFKIYNEESEDITVDVSLENQDASIFRLNVDGETGNEVTGVRVGANDSIYVFADVTVNPDQPVSISPFVIEENLIITSQGSSKQVLMTAWGQNANYIPGTDGKGKAIRLFCEGQEIWDDPKPYVIYGIVQIDDCEVILPAGTNVYIHGGVVVREDLIYNDGLILVTETAKIITQGTVDNPVTFQGDRLEDSFDERAGQWVGIWLLPGSQGNMFESTFIKNSTVGVRVDSLSEATFDKVEIKNTTASGLIGRHGTIKATNTLVHSNGQNAVTLSHGGNYDFEYCTFASYGNQAPALRMDNYFIYLVEDADDIISFNPLTATITNTIITGNDQDELSMEDGTRLESPAGTPGFFNYQFTNCLLTIEDLLEAEAFPNFFDNCENCERTSFGDALFLDTDLPDYHLDTLSVAEMKALPLPSVFDDFEQNVRDATNPDIGCYEYQY